jgi:hypothetical protein
MYRGKDQRYGLGIGNNTNVWSKILLLAVLLLGLNSRDLELPNSFSLLCAYESIAICYNFCLKREKALQEFEVRRQKKLLSKVQNFGMDRVLCCRACPGP